MSGRRYPAAARLELTERLFGHPVPDPYRWLEDAADPHTAAWLAAQGELYRRERDQWPARSQWAARLAELAAAGVGSLPRPRGKRLFYTRRDPGQQHPVLVVRGPAGRERPLLDPLALDPAGTTTLAAWQPSIEGDLVAYQLAEGGTGESVLRVLDIATGEAVDGPVDRVRRSPVAWLPGGTAFYYVRRLHPDLVPAAERQYHRRVYLHRLGTDPAADAPVFGAGRGHTDYYSVRVSVDGRWLVVGASAGTARGTELWLADLAGADPGRPELRCLQPAGGGRTVPYLRPGMSPADPMLLLTDRDAPRGRLATATPEPGAPWTDLVGQRPDAVLADIAVLDGAELDRPLLLVVWTEDAASTITVHDLATGAPVGTVPLPGRGTVGNIVDRPDGGAEAWFSYTDFTTPRTVYRYDGHTGRCERWSARPRPEVPEVQTRQVTYRSADGTTVGMFVVSRPGPGVGPPSGPAPAILTGYGGFGSSTTPDYSPLALAWVAAGGVYAVANVRGGGEQGEGWHRAGSRDRKQNAVDDLHAAADWLAHNGWTTPAQLGLLGQSNGGLLVGAALTQHPEKYAAVVGVAPLLDMVRYERSGLGPSWTPEYGTAADPEQLRWLLSYSPYHHVRAGTRYPAVLLVSFDADTVVDPLHARKMCAALQHATAGSAPILLRSEGQVGHGARALARGVDALADTVAFLAAHLGLPADAARSPVVAPGSLPLGHPDVVDTGLDQAGAEPEPLSLIPGPAVTESRWAPNR
jgi:prolyl oligopeptidase